MSDRLADRQRLLGLNRLALADYAAALERQLARDGRGRDQRGFVPVVADDFERADENPLTSTAWWARPATEHRIVFAPVTTGQAWLDDFQGGDA